MSNLVQFDTNALQKKVKDHIQGSFGMLIPEEQFQNLVDEAINEFFTSEKAFEVVTKREQIPSNSYSPQYREYQVLTTPISPFKAMIWEQVQVLVRERLDLYIEQEVNALKEQLKVNLSTELEGAISGNVSLIAKQMEDIRTNLLVQSALVDFQANLRNVLGQQGIRVDQY